MVSKSAAAVAVGSSLLLACPELATGHAVLLEPPSRNYIANQAGKENCPHCLQSGGPDAVKARASGVWPTVLEPSSHGLCGDPGQGLAEPSSLATSTYLVPTPVQRTYQAGEIVEFRVGVNAHHKGHYEFRICDMALDGTKLGSADEGQACLNKWVLERAPVDSSSCSSGSAKADCQPIDEKHPGRWYIPPANQGTMVAGASFHDENVPPAVSEYHVMKYKIPDGLSCTQCTLQWYWSTGNSCLYDADYLGPTGYFQRNAAAFQALGWKAEDWCPFCVATWATCDNSCCKTGGSFGEEFWNCADIAVTASGNGPAPTTAAPSTVTATTTPAVTTATTTTQSIGSDCSARPGNLVSATDDKCVAACRYMPADTWPCNQQGPCACAGGAQPSPIPNPTPSPTPSPTTAPTTAPTPASGSCAAAWGQCGGNSWTGATCCVSGHICNRQSEWYSQCIPR
eukprot:TRINITY_DN2626_c0_g3_i1.p1 TRINITY_DN2626_c0_g3~~TRINITY_DN2626_c0_g3_i1.p1  ORF type:complete len:455 (-),score=58.81 TRINITY_DN2626_c0_g3_i1:374-1738(-)